MYIYVKCLEQCLINVLSVIIVIIMVMIVIVSKIN